MDWADSVMGAASYDTDAEEESLPSAPTFLFSQACLETPTSAKKIAKKGKAVMEDDGAVQHRSMKHIIHCGMGPSIPDSQIDTANANSQPLTIDAIVTKDEPSVPKRLVNATTKRPYTKRKASYLEITQSTVVVCRRRNSSPSDHRFHSGETKIQTSGR